METTGSEPPCYLGNKQPKTHRCDYPQDFTGVNTDSGKGMTALHDYIMAVRHLPLEKKQKEAMLGGTAAELLKLG